MAPPTTCPVDCGCHVNMYAPCTVPGGCGSEGCGRASDRRCAASERCRDFDHTRGLPALLGDPSTPLCPDCLMVAERDVRNLPYDYIDLEQMLPQPISRPLDTQSGYGGSRDLPVPLRVHVDELQRAIWWVTTCWAEVLGEHQRLSDPPWLGRQTDRDPRRRVRDGYAVKWAVGIITPRVRDLARLPAVDLADYPLVDPAEAIQHHGTEIATLSGAQGLIHMTRLHARVRSMLGITRRITRVPGRCGCGLDGNYLYRGEPHYERDPCPVYCGACPNQWTTEEYEQYVGLMQAHPELADVEGIDYGPESA